jgi:quinol monooxygenase YgiN
VITLISRWKLRNGCPPELLRALGALADAVHASEPGTLSYHVSLNARDPLGPDRRPASPLVAPIPADEQTEVVFAEAYRDAEAFADHLNGPAFAKFRTQHLGFFIEDPDRAGWPLTDTTFLTQEATSDRGAATAPGGGAWPAATLLAQATRAIEARDWARLETLLGDDLVAVVPLASPAATIDKARFVAWIESYCEGIGTLRMTPTTVLHGSTGSVGAVVTHTGFDAPPTAEVTNTKGTGGRPYWFSIPTIAAATADASGTTLASLFLITDRPEQKNRDQMIQRVLDWFEAYVDQDDQGFLTPLSPDLQAYSYNAYSPQPPPAVSKDAYRTGFAEWCAANREGGFILGEVVAHGSYVGLRVQFITEVRPDQSRLPGQQRMTDEIHVFELDERLEIRRAYFFETNMCGCPTSPCEW